MDFSLLVFLLVLAALGAVLWMFARKVRSKSENPVRRAVRLVKQQSGEDLKPDEVWFVPDDEEWAVKVADTTAASRTNHAPGILVRQRNGVMQVTRLDKDVNPGDVRDTDFFNA